MSLPGSALLHRFAGATVRATLLASVGIAACGSGAAAQGKVDEPRSAMASASFGTNADSLYAKAKARLQRKHYRFDKTDDANREMIVRAPKDKTKVAVSVVTRGDSASISIRPIDAHDLMSSMQSLLVVTTDATMDSVSDTPPAATP
jgi:hypothetical protein